MAGRARGLAPPEERQPVLGLIPTDASHSRLNAHNLSAFWRRSAPGRGDYGHIKRLLGFRCIA
jgi:hypothetical protein